MRIEENHHRETVPLWKQHFPISWLDDDYVTRREFTKSLGLVSLAAFIATSAVAAVNALRRRAKSGHPILRVAGLQELRVGESKVFHYPGPGDPCLLVRLDERSFVAYEQKCTHLGCPVHYDHAAGKIVCPCHRGFFHVDDGSALAGPPKRALPKIGLELKGDDLWTTGNIG